MTAPVSRATLPSASVEGPGMGSARSKLAWSSDWQKYCERKSSGRQMICPPCPAASRTRAMALSKLAGGSGPHCIWISATRVAALCDWRISSFGSATVLRRKGDRRRPLLQMGSYFTESAGTILTLSRVTRVSGLLSSPPGARPTGVAPILSRTSRPLITLPKAVYWWSS